MTSGLENQAPAKNGTSTPTVMLKGIFEQVAEGQNVSKKQAQNLLAGMVETMTEHLKRGDRIRINGLGTLEVRQREARTGRNPATGEMMQIAASKKVAFRSARTENTSADANILSLSQLGLAGTCKPESDCGR